MDLGGPLVGKAKRKKEQGQSWTGRGGKHANIFFISTSFLDMTGFSGDVGLSL